MPLEGVRVLDFTQQYPGPLSTLLLSEFGAEVWKVEPPTGDLMRSRFGGVFESVNRHKRGVAANLKDPDDRRMIQEAVGHFDVVVEGFRPGVAKRLEIDYGTLSSRNPDLVYCSISGFGQTGPYSRWPGHDVNYVGISPAVWFSGEPSAPPEWTVGVPIADVLTGQFAVMSVMAAIRQRDQDGFGQYIDLSMSDVMLSATEIRLQEYFAKGGPSREEQMARASFGVFTCADGAQVALGAVEEKFWLALCELLGLDDLVSDSELHDFEHRNRQWRTIRPRIAKAFLEESRDVWLEKVDQTQLPLTPVNSPEDAMVDPQFAERGVIHRHDDGFHVGLPAIFTGFEPRGSGPSPGLGEHNDAFSAEFTKGRGA